MDVPLSSVQVCEDTSDCIELLPNAGLYLKPLAKLSITVTLPKLSTGQSISNNEVSCCLRNCLNFPLDKLSLKFLYYSSNCNKMFVSVYRL